MSDPNIDVASGRSSDGGPTPSRVTVYGDFSCPWSYLTWRRTEVLRADGVEIDWRTVEHDPWHPLGPEDRPRRAAELRDELHRVEQHLLPGERLPHTGTVSPPFTGAATSAYAEAYVAQVAHPVRRRLFEACWRHEVDLNDARAVRAMLVDDIRKGTSTVELLHLWGYAVDVTGGPITGVGWSTIRDWQLQWRELAAHDPDSGLVVPVAIIDDEPPARGVAALEAVGRLVVERGLDPGGIDAAGEPTDVPAA